MDINQQFTELKKDLLEQWLSHYQSNQQLIARLCLRNATFEVTGETLQSEDIALLTQDKQTTKGYAPCRPPSWYILGFIVGLDPKFSSLIQVAASFTSDLSLIVQQLGLNIDPNLANLRKNQSLTVANTPQITSSELDDIREQIKLQNGEIT